ncbi:MAG: imelysin family protein [Pseudomonadota bacterium]
MQRLLFLAFASLLAVTFGLMPSALSADTSKAVIEKAVTGYILPSQQEFSTASQALSGEVKTLCEAPSPESLDGARMGFDELVSAWAAVSVVNIGPIMEKNRRERLLFWPDRRGVGLRQVQAVLSEKDPQAATVAGLAQKSVALQGLAALEFVLYGTGSETLSDGLDDYRCRFAIAISGNIANIASELLDGWQDPDGFAIAWENPAEDNDLYRNETEALSALVNLFTNGFEYFDTVEIGGFLGTTPDRDRPRRALFRRSGNTLKLLRDTMSEFQSLYEASEVATLLPEEFRWIEDRISFGFRQANGSLASLSGTAADLVEEPEQRSKLAYIALVTRGLNDDFGNKLTGALGLTSNFSSLDGD